MKYDTDYFDCLKCHGNGCDICGGTGKSNISVHKSHEKKEQKSVNSEWYQWYLYGMADSFFPKKEQQ